MPEYFERANALNKTDFVRQAIDFYMGYLDSQSSVDFIALIISNCIQDNIDKDNIDDVYELCKREVAKTNGLFDFRQAHRLQNQAQYNEWQK